MFRGVADGAVRAVRVAEYLGSHANFKSHSRRVKLEQLQRDDFGLNIRNMRENSNLFSLVWEVYCAMDIIFVNTPIYKLFYNSMDDAMVRFGQAAGVELVVGPAIPTPQRPAVPPS